MTIFMEGLRNEVAMKEVFSVHTLTFEEAVDVALNAEFNFKATCCSIQCQSSSKAEPMDLSYAEDEAILQAAEQQRNIRRCYMCGSTKRFRSTCPLQ